MATAADAFRPSAHGRWLADLYTLARQRLAAIGIERVSGGGLCTLSDAERFFSYRRDGTTGRMATLIWIDAGP
jgi:copper oxidase (laccase) domain-containing protein